MFSLTWLIQGCYTSTYYRELPIVDASTHTNYLIKLLKSGCGSGLYLSRTGLTIIQGKPAPSTDVS
jgi:hypothetical protein